MPPKMKREPTYPEINWLRAAIYDRKNSLHLTWDDLGDTVGCSGGALRQLMHASPDPWTWPQYTLKKVCKALGIEIRQCVAGSPEDRN